MAACTANCTILRVTRSLPNSPADRAITGLVTTKTNPLVQKILDVLATKGKTQYGRECVSQEEHALQCALLASEAGAGDELVAAALLHDIGHLLHDPDDGGAEQAIDDVHENVGAQWLANHAPAAVIEPVRLHVDAKRYLCAVDSDYYDILSNASKVSLKLQGGPMTRAEVTAFEQNPYWRDAVKLRRWDDEAKVQNKTTPPLGEFAQVLERALSAAA